MSLTSNQELVDLASKWRIPLVGVFSKNELPLRPHNGGWIINLQDDEDTVGNPLGGTHWTAFYIEGREAVYFDSFGFPPPLEVITFLKDFKPFPFNNKHIQNVVSGYCGQYCLFFIYFMCSQKGPLVKRMNKLCDLFSDDTEKNLTILKKYLHIN